MMRIFCAVIVAALATLMLAGCGSSSDSNVSGGVDSPDDGLMDEQMTECVKRWMSEVAVTSEVDFATSDQLGAANEVYLEDCGNQRIADFNIEAGYECNGNGCFGKDEYGYTWRDVAADWACENRPDLCSLTE